MGGGHGGRDIGAHATAGSDRSQCPHGVVPFVDGRTTCLDPSRPVTVSEWEEGGNPLEDATAYALMKSYAPYDNVTARAHPAGRSGPLEGGTSAGAPLSAASAASSSAETSRGVPTASGSRIDWEVNQFWQ